MAIASRCWWRVISISGRSMSCAMPQPIVDAQASSLALTLRALRPLLEDPDVTELCINRPQEAFIETQAGWQCVSIPFADFDWCGRLAKLIANSTQQRVDS